MSDFERLKEKIAKLRARDRAPGDARVLKGQSPEARLAAILGEIDETILPRKITCRWGEGRTLSMGVLNRRLQSIVAPSDAALNAWVGKPLTDPDDAMLQDLKTALLDALKDAGPLKLGITRLSDDLGSDVGLAATTLARTWGLAVGAKGLSAAEAVSAFLNGLEDDAVAWLLIDGEEVSDQKGSDEALARLGETAAYLLDAYLNGREALFKSGSGARTLAVATSDRGVFFVDAVDRSAFVTMDTEKLGAVMSAWRGASA